MEKRTSSLKREHKNFTAATQSSGLKALLLVRVSFCSFQSCIRTSTNLQEMDKRLLNAKAVFILTYRSIFVYIGIP